MDKLHDWQKIINAVKEMDDEFDRRQDDLKYVHAYEAFKAFKEIVTDKQFNNIWNNKKERQFYQILNLDKKDKAYSFRVNIALAHILKKLGGTRTKKGLIKVNCWPKVNLYPRPNLALNKNEYVYDDIVLFESMLDEIVDKKPSFSLPSEELCIWLILRLIAVDGVLIGEADKNIRRMTVEHLHVDGLAPRISIPIGKSVVTGHKQYAITEDTAYILKILINRAKKENGEHFIFPASLRLAKDKKKTLRRTKIEEKLKDLCYAVNPDYSTTDDFGIKWWIQMSRQHMEINDVPYVAIGNMRNKIRVAQLRFNTQKQHRSKSVYLKSINQEPAYELLRIIQTKFRKFYYEKSRSMDQKLKLKQNIELRIRGFDELSEVPLKWRQFFAWIEDLLENKEYSNYALSTLYSHTSTLPNSVFEFIKQDDLRLLGRDDWLGLAKEISNNVESAVSSRTNALTHLRRFQEYLFKTYESVPFVNWSMGHNPVHRSIAEGSFIVQEELDAILKDITEGSKEWTAIFLAYYGGLRCEEIFNLRKRDFVDLERVPVLRSKTKAGYRVIPLASFLESGTESKLRSILKQSADGDVPLVQFQDLETPNALSKSVERMMARLGRPNISLHTFRHSFASMQLLRYFVLLEPEMKPYLLETLPSIPSSMLEGNMMKELAHVFGGSTWANDYEKFGKCFSTPSDLCTLSKLMGHASRQTTLENYCNSFFWLQRYWMLKREKNLLS